MSIERKIFFSTSVGRPSRQRCRRQSDGRLLSQTLAAGGTSNGV
ncbi:MAG: hypothetical protein WC483_01145 [Candidatus Paceibacterota bacterium]